MAIKQSTVTIDGSFSSLSISGDTQVSGSMSWTIPMLPDGAEIISTYLEATCSLVMRKGKANFTINKETYYNSTTLSLDLGDSLISSMNVVAKGGNKNANGTLSITNIIYTITYSHDDRTYEPPIITIQSQDRHKISNISGYDRCTVTFTSDQELSYWEARATLPDVAVSHGVGLLIESGSLESGETGYVYVDDDELTNGDIEYTITIYGQNAVGVWSDE